MSQNNSPGGSREQNAPSEQPFRGIRNMRTSQINNQEGELDVVLEELNPRRPENPPSTPIQASIPYRSPPPVNPPSTPIQASIPYRSPPPVQPRNPAFPAIYDNQFVWQQTLALQAEVGRLLDSINQMERRLHPPRLGPQSTSFSVSDLRRDWPLHSQVPDLHRDWPLHSRVPDLHRDWPLHSWDAELSAPAFGGPCPICTDDLAVDLRRMPCCSLVVCAACVRRWLGMYSATCPTCRRVCRVEDMFGFDG